MATKVIRREFLQLSHIFDADKHDPVGMWASRKLDGQRAVFIPQTRGMRTVDVPWANLDKKVRPIATGLWSRYSNVIEAPNWFLDALPNEVLDGELYCGPGSFQTTMSIVKRDVPDDRWKQVKFAVYGAPDLCQLFQSGEIKNANLHKVIDENDCRKLFPSVEWDTGRDFQAEYLKICKATSVGDVAYAVEQIKILSNAHLHDFHKQVTAEGCEGVVLRDPQSRWTPKRMSHSLKVKERFDSECRVVGFIAGRKGKADQVFGKLGALIVEWQGKRFELGSGLARVERELDPLSVFEMACANPGKELPITDTGNVMGTRFKVGDIVTFSYRELSKDGVPKEATYCRKFQTL